MITTMTPEQLDLLGKAVIYIGILAGLFLTVFILATLWAIWREHVRTATIIACPHCSKVTTTAQAHSRHMKRRHR